MDAHGCISVVRGVDQARDVRQPQEIAVAEDRPAAIAHQIRYEKSRIRKIGGCQRIDIACVQASGAQLVLNQGLDVERDGCVFLQRMATDMKSYVFAPVVTDIDRERRR